MSRKLAATGLGREVHQVLSTKLPGLFETTFTAGIETALDEIAAGKKNGHDYLHRFWTQVSLLFGQHVITATLSQTAPSKGGAEGAATNTKRTGRTKSPKTPHKAKAAASTPVSSEFGPCPKCGKELVKPKRPRGEFLG